MTDAIAATGALYDRRDPASPKPLYDRHGVYLGTAYENKIVTWMSEHGKTGYAQDIDDDRSTYYLVIGEAGPDWRHCPFTRERLEKLNHEIKEAFRAACDRYEDWASD